MEFVVKSLLVLLSLCVVFNLYVSAVMLREFQNKPQRTLEFATAVTAVALNASVILGGIIFLANVKHMML